MKAIPWFGAILFLVIAVGLVVIAREQIIEEHAQEYAVFFYVPAIIVGVVDLVFWLMVLL